VRGVLKAPRATALAAALCLVAFACGSGSPPDAGATGTAGQGGSKAGVGGQNCGTAGASGQAGGGQAGSGDQAGAGGQAGGGQAGVGGQSGAADDGAAGASDAGAAPLDAGSEDVAMTTMEAGTCAALVAQHPDEGAFHVNCTPVPTYGTEPPSSGNHYPIWADFKTYTTPVPWGHLVHSLEHGAIVIVYNCPCGCDAEVAQAQAMIDALPVDPICTAPTKRRVILAPDPTLDVRWAASAWTWTLRASCFDAAAFNDFARAHYGMGGEDLCGELHEPFCAVP
jgi:Protein of unknown function (DUF3105)